MNKTFLSQQRIGAGVFIPSSKTAVYADSGGAGISNTITEQN